MKSLLSGLWGCRYFWIVLLTTVCWPVGLHAGGTPAVGDPSDPLLTLNGGSVPASAGDWISASDGLDLTHTFFIEVPPGTPRLVIDLFDPDVLGADFGEDERNGDRDLLRGAPDTDARYQLFDPLGELASFRFGVGNQFLDGDNSWRVFFDSSTADAVGPATFRDNFDMVSYSNQDGNQVFSTPWIETGETGTAGPTGGILQVTGGGLSISNTGDAPPFSSSPGVERGLDLSSYEAVVLTFDWDTGFGLEDNDAVVLESSNDGGLTWIGLAIFDGMVSGPSSGHHRVDLSDFLVADARIRFRIYNSFAGAGEAFFIDNFQIQASAEINGPSPAPGHWMLTVDMRDAELTDLSQDENNAFGLRAHTGDPGPEGAEINVYANSFVSLNVNENERIRIYEMFPYISEGCELDINDFDFDSDAPDPMVGKGIAPPYGSWDLLSPGGFAADEVSVLSTNATWNSATVVGFNTDVSATEYGIWTLGLSIADFGSGNLATVYLGQEDAADVPPLGSPEANTVRVYFPRDDGTAPSKPFLSQEVRLITGPNPPVEGQISRLVVQLDMVNPLGSIGPINFDRSEGRDIVIATPSSTAEVEMSFVDVVSDSPSAGDVLVLGGSPHMLSWDPGTIPIGGSETLLFMIDVMPLVSITAVPLTQKTNPSCWS